MYVWRCDLSLSSHFNSTITAVITSNHSLFDPFSATLPFSLHLFQVYTHNTINSLTLFFFYYSYSAPILCSLLCSEETHARNLWPFLWIFRIVRFWSEMVIWVLLCFSDWGFGSSFSIFWDFFFGFWFLGFWKWLGCCVTRPFYVCFFFWFVVFFVGFSLLCGVFGLREIFGKWEGFLFIKMLLELGYCLGL